MNPENILFGLMLSLFAGLATGLGAVAVFFLNLKDLNLSRILSASLGLSAGVMISVSIFELIPYAIEETNFILGSTFFFLGFIFIMIIDFKIPHSYHAESTLKEKDPSNSKEKENLTKVGLLTAFGLSIHNFPEGLASFSGAVINPALGIVTAVAIAIHNIPEGLSIAVPLSYTKGKKFAFSIALISGLTEPIGALIGALILLPFLDQLGPYLGLLLSFVAGIMIFISFDELLPAAREYDGAHVTTTWLLIGMIVMTVTISLL